MSNFWLEHSTEATVEMMMLDEAAEILTEKEVPEILDLLPQYTGKDVLELGAGIGRFTGHLAKQAASVMAVDFMESFIEKNRQLNSHHGNIKFIQADVLKLDLPEKSVDIIFTNWLLMYMSDEEVQTFFINCLRWLKEDGYLFFRESCYHQSGNVKRTVNPTRYRSPLEYTGALNMAMVQSEKGIPGRFGYEITISKPVDTYIKYKSNYNQICWLAQKVHQSEPFSSSSKTFQEFLDQQQYSRNGILRYEKIFGRHFISTGGLDTTKEFVNMLELRPKQKVLDVGSGIGGSAFYMAKVKFLVADATKMSIPAESFDVVYSRDTILHIPDKAALFERFLILEKVGFVNVKAEDKTSLFIDVLSKELKKMETVKDEFLQVCNFKFYMINMQIY
ncbi:hypothetical protein LSH36_988g00035 [Paralvinella palmiformis]|uniref:phosphoethanolamine N-methyltransferase n=1 Tax=Paralvinella palmiformis TaxID=53620 RepID=A0AAD9IWH7_9ANNE|nr:hypothetical protein LSH36_988g00035 [Paralvinella palmiformis]